MILVTGGAGFIGSNFILDWLAACDEAVLNVDKLTYAGNLHNLESLQGDARHIFVHADVGNSATIGHLLEQHRPRAVLHFAAESHVDRSIAGPRGFIDANIVSTFALLEAVRAWWGQLPGGQQAAFRFVHISTDEVYGSLAPHDAPFTEQHPYQPNSPYSASKAASDHLVRAWQHTWGLPTLTTHCSNNYGPRHFPEKLIPLAIVQALEGKPLPLYGDGLQVRDWLYVSDHCAAIRRVLEAGSPGGTWNIGGNCEMTNLALIQTLCDLLDRLRPRMDGASYRAQITHVRDRPGHDRRYAIDAGKIARELGWRPAHTFEQGLEKTVRWYLENPQWVQAVRSGAYRSAP